jgi:hypothetical protein
VQAIKSIPNPTMAVDIKILALQELGYILIGLWINQNSPDNGFFSFFRVRDHLWRRWAICKRKGIIHTGDYRYKTGAASLAAWRTPAAQTLDSKLILIFFFAVIFIKIVNLKFIQEILKNGETFFTLGFLGCPSGLSTAFRALFL